MYSMGHQNADVRAPLLKILVKLMDEFRLLRVALSSSFVMSAVLALSASHLAWETKNSDTEQLAYYHRGIALKGLHEAIGTFSRENSEAILAASMLLSWQATEW